MLDPLSARTDERPLRGYDRWGYAGDYADELDMPVEEPSNPARWLLWVVVLAIVVVAILALSGVRM
jgi:hypothetical protein